MRQAEQGRTVRLMFQDEGRFGLLGTPRRCWAPHNTRPVVGARLERKYIYAFSAVSPHDGVMDSLVLPWVNAETMSLFLAEVAERHAEQFIMMVMDQAGWHLAGDLEVSASPTTSSQTLTLSKLRSPGDSCHLNPTLTEPSQ